MWKKSFVVFSTVAACGFAVAAQARDESAQGSPAYLKSLLERQGRLVDLIEPGVTRLNRARLRNVRRAIGTILADMRGNVDAHRQLVTNNTSVLVDDLIRRYRYSKVLFGWTEPVSLDSVYTDAIAPYLSELKASSEELERQFGYDQNPLGGVTWSFLMQAQTLLQQLENLPIDAGLNADLRALAPEILRVAALARSMGDRRTVYDSAVPLVVKFRAFYPRLMGARLGGAADDAVLEFQGLVEDAAEFLQIRNEP